jgi:hypothetical protein
MHFVNSGSVGFTYGYSPSCPSGKLTAGALTPRGAELV